MKIAFKITILSFLVFFGSWFFVYSCGYNKLAIQSEDTLPTLFLPLTILQKGTLFLDDYVPMMREKYPHPDDKSYTKGLVPFYLRKINNHYVSAFPVITAVLSVPVYFVALTFDKVITWNYLIIVSHLSAALILALSGGMLYLLLDNFFFMDSRKAVLLTCVYLFATINFALISQALWQHGTLQLLLICTTYFILNYQRKSTLVSGLLAGLFGSLAILSRPTAALSVGLLALYVLIANIKSVKKVIFVIAFLIGLLPSLLFFSWYNKTFYQDIKNQGYSNQIFRSWLSPFPQSFAGVWVSPSKGILIYSPVFIFSFVGLYLLRKKDNSYKVFYILCFLIVVLHTLIISLWKHWYGGWSFGYRMSSDIIPYLVLLLVPFLNSDSYVKYRNIFLILVCISVFVQISGMVFFDGIWHAAYDRGFTNTGWLWSLRDSELAFNIRRVLVKLSVLRSPL